MPSLNDLQNLQTDEVASFGQGEMFADADGGAGASESLPMGTYNFEPPKERQEVGALAAISKLLKSQQQMLRDENKKEVPNPRRVEMLTNEIAALLEKKEGLKKAKKWGGII
jgi:hypothetical protein